MKFSSSVVYTVAASLAGLVAAADEKVIGSFVFGRHGDRLAKPKSNFTPIGQRETNEGGAFLRARYIDPDSENHIDGLNVTYDKSMTEAMAPNSALLYQSLNGYMQGLFPPLGDIGVNADTVTGSSMYNGTSESANLNNYQPFVIQGADDGTPNGIWIDGSTGCPAFNDVANAYFKTDEFKKLNTSTYDFYQSLYDLADGALSKSVLNYGNAYTVFDYFWVNTMHNETIAKNFEGKDKQEVLFQIRTLQDQYSKYTNYDVTNTTASTVAGAGVIGAMLNQLNTTLIAGTPVFNIYTGSYSTMYQTVALLGLFDTYDEVFTGLVNYAALFMFDLIEKDGDNYVRFTVRNGTQTEFDIRGMGTVEPTSYPLFDFKDELMPYDDFVSKANEVAIRNVKSWCNTCGAWDQSMCIPYNAAYIKAKAADFKVDSSLTLAGAGGIGAGVTLGVVAIAGALAFLIFGRKRSKVVNVEEGPAMTQKSSGSFQSNSNKS
ncbi:hypothetical protein TRVA0_005S03642 [Trichomonascus vanleenenianus]|uniref:uncharacterized protein n=1 Tax=Trichomonascus vanleenenianus TaxID=2268995 RepID=UPI003ECB0A60